MKRAVIVLISALLLAEAACGDGGDSENLIAVEPIDFSGVELSAEDVYTFGPPQEYPDVVARVNGQNITAEALASRQVMLELNGRFWQTEAAEGFPAEIADMTLDAIESVDPLETLIDETLLEQVAERRGLLPSMEEGIEYARQQQEGVEQGTDELDAIPILLGVEDDDWGENAQLVEHYRRAAGLGRVRNEFCDPPPTPATPLGGSLGPDCSSFLAEERDDADIEYFVRWAE